MAQEASQPVALPVQLPVGDLPAVLLLDRYMRRKASCLLFKYGMDNSFVHVVYSFWRYVISIHY
jgi:hypothetical protein